jgi:uncharacterized protein GlcG (DUF336 family)
LTLPEIAIRNPSVSLTAAQAVIAAALDKASEEQVPMAIAVLDSGGNLVALARQDGAVLSAPRLAMQKARTVLESGQNTQDLWEFVKDDQELVIGLAATPEMMIVGGGVKLEHGGSTIGAVGASGGHYSGDIAVAEAGAAALAPQAAG